MEVYQEMNDERRWSEIQSLLAFFRFRMTSIDLKENLEEEDTEIRTSSSQKEPVIKH